MLINNFDKQNFDCFCTHWDQVRGLCVGGDMAILFFDPVYCVDSTQFREKQLYPLFNFLFCFFSISKLKKIFINFLKTNFINFLPFPNVGPKI